MLETTIIWMCVSGLVCLVTGVFLYHKDFSAARGWDKFICLAPLLIAVPLAVFAPEHFSPPLQVPEMVPSWIPAHLFWAYFVGCALYAAAASLAAKKFVYLSSFLTGLMLFLFVCLMHIPNAFADPHNRFVWIYAMRDLTFAAGGLALAGVYARASSEQQSKWLILAARYMLAITAIFFAVEHCLHPEFAPGVPLEKITPAWVLFPRAWGYLTGAILLAAGIGLLLNKKSRLAATTIGVLITVLTLFLYLPIWILACSGTSMEIIEAMNYFFDTLLYAGSALALALALPRDSDRVQKM
jgi:uncharacterized membrane protein